MANPSIKQQLNDLIAQVISRQIGDPMHKDEWEEVRRPLLEALNNLEKVGSRTMSVEKKAESLTAHDSTIREPLFDFLEEKYGKIRIIEEKTIGRVRADVVMVTPEAL